MSLPALWISEIPAQESPDWETLLCADELDRLRGISAPGRRMQFLATRALLRRALGDEFQIDPKKFQVSARAGEAPKVLNAPKPVCLSLSHTDSACAVLIAESPCGVDIEDSARERDYLGLAKTAFDPTELADFDRAPGREAFYALWTAKEARYKAGAGAEPEISTVHHKSYRIAVALSAEGLKKIILL
jgi:4'-phosphopantetheinyl transferase